MLNPAQPGHGTLDAHAKTGMRHATEAAQVEVPLEGLERQAMLRQTPLQHVQFVNPLTAADDFAVAFAGQHIDAQYNLGRCYDKGLYLTPSDPDAYVWLNLAAAQGTEDAALERDNVAARMTHDQIIAAQQRAATFVPHPETIK